MTRISLAVLLLFCTAASGQAAKAKALNAEGFSLYKQQKYREAIDKFVEATNADDRSVGTTSPRRFL